MPSQQQRNMNALGDMLKNIERSHDISLLPKVPIYARLDGKAFSKFTRGMGKPYDPALTKIMVDVTKTLVAETNATLGYTQSDEISLYWENGSLQTEMPFAGRRDKMLGELVGLATAAFMRETMSAFPERLDKLPRFDCRVFNCSAEDAALFFLWREMDATKNSITLAAGQHFSHKRLQGISSKQRREWLTEAGNPWEAYPAFFKRGVYVGHFARQVPVSDMDVPEHIKPTLPPFVDRRVVEAFTREPVQRLESPLEVFDLDETRYPDITPIRSFPLHQGQKTFESFAAAYEAGHLKTYYQPHPEHMPVDMFSFEVYGSLENGIEQTGIPCENWIAMDCSRNAPIERPTFLD